MYWSNERSSTSKYAYMGCSLTIFVSSVPDEWLKLNGQPRKGKERHIPHTVEIELGSGLISIDGPLTPGAGKVVGALAHFPLKLCPACGVRLSGNFVDLRFDDGAPALIQHGDFRGININTDYIVSNLCKAGGCD